MDILLLTTPPQHTSSNPCVETNPRKLKLWIDGLPTMNVTETVKLLQNAIEPFNELQLVDEERIRLLEIYREELETLLFDYDEMRLHQLPISSEQRSSVAQDIMWLYLSLANGYKSVIKNHHERDANPKHDKTLLLCMYRAMELIVAALLYSYRAHESFPPLACLEINQLYLFAESFNAQDIRIRAVKKQDTNTVASLYKKFLLLSCVRMQRFNGGELLELYFLLDKFAGHSTLSKYEESEPGTGKYVTDLTEDALPHHWATGEPIPMGGILRVFDLAGALDEINEWLGQQGGPQDSLIQAHEARLVGVLRDELENQQNDSGPTGEQSRNVKVVVGLQQLSRVLNDSEWLNNACAVEECAGIEVRSFNSEEEASVDSGTWEMISEQDSRFELRSVQVEDTISLEAGALVGIIDGCETQEGPAVTIGIVRWVKDGKRDTTTVGVERLDGEPIPVSCLTTNNANTTAIDQGGLYFPGNNSSKQPATLLMGRKILDYGQPLDIAVNGKSFRVQPQTTVNATPMFAQFCFRVLSKQA